MTVEDEAFPQSIRNIYLNNNQLRFTLRNTFSNLTNLATLRLDNNHISLIFSTTFANCSNLYYINLQSNQIGWLNSSMFQDCVSMTTFYASSNQIAHIGDNTFSHMPLSNLDLSYNKLTELSNTSKDFHSKSFSYLRLYGNQLTSIRSNTFNRTSATYFYLHYNQIAYIDSNGFIDCSATYLYLTPNPLKYIRSYAFNRGTYYNLYMQGNGIRHLPSHAFYDISGTYLRLENNQIRYIEEEAFYVRYTYLYLHDNNLLDIAGTMFTHGSSVYNSLYLHRNALTVLLPATFVGLSAFAVSLSYNKLITYPGDALSVLNLQTIDLSFNEISVIPDDSFINSDTLKVLNLEGNFITHLQDNLLDKAVLLEKLSFTNNSITYVAEGLLNNNLKVDEIFLTRNKIYHLPRIAARNDSLVIHLDLNPVSSISANAFDYLDDKSSVILNTESLQCGCAAYISLTLSNVEVTGRSATCAFPSSVAGISLLTNSPDKVKRNDFLCAPIDLEFEQPNINVISLSWALDKEANYDFDVTAAKQRLVIFYSYSHIYIFSTMYSLP